MAEHGTRDEIRRRIERDAGVYFNELVRQSGWAPGQLQYHLQRLVESGDVIRSELYGRTHYYPEGYDAWQREVIALFRRETPREVMIHLLENQEETPQELVEELEVPRSTLEHHLGNLVDSGVVYKRRDGDSSVTVGLVDADRTAETLKSVESTVPEQLVDRFTQLVDGFLD